MSATLPFPRRPWGFCSFSNDWKAAAVFKPANPHYWLKWSKLIGKILFSLSERADSPGTDLYSLTSVHIQYVCVRPILCNGVNMCSDWTKRPYENILLNMYKRANFRHSHVEEQKPLLVTWLVPETLLKKKKQVSTFQVFIRVSNRRQYQSLSFSSVQSEMCPGLLNRTGSNGCCS